MYIDYDSCIWNEGTRNLIFQQSFNDSFKIFILLTTINLMKGNQGYNELRVLITHFNDVLLIRWQLTKLRWAYGKVHEAVISDKVYWIEINQMWIMWWFRCARKKWLFVRVWSVFRTKDSNKYNSLWKYCFAA